MNDDFAGRAMRQANTDNFKQALPDAIEGMRNMAVMRYHNYRAHIDAGFTPAEALKLCGEFYVPSQTKR